jgi:hypothetical protein
MRLLLMSCGVAALAAVGWIFAAAVRDSREWREVLAFAEKDLKATTMEDQWRVGQLLRKRFPGPEFDATRPWFGLRLLGPKGSERVAIVHAFYGEFAPAFSGIFVSVFDEDRRHLSVIEIRMGYAANVHDARGPVVGAPGPWFFEMTVAPKSEDHSLERHIYALIDGRPVLVRLEGAGGVLRPNEYSSDMIQVGEQVPERRPEEWERALGSADLAEVLRTLVWLGGEHGDPRETPSDGDESTASRQAYRDLLQRPGVKSKMIELRMHPHPWVAEAAAQVEIAD